jgi:O-antigen/teichoic acid export membrane protein
MFVGLVMPLLSESINLLPRFRQIFQRSFDLLFVFAWPLAFGVFMLAGPIISLLGGNEYNESVVVLQILMFAVVAIFSSTLFSYSLVSLNQQKKLLFISAFGAVFNLVINLIFIPRYSYLAVAWASLLTEVLVAVCMAIVIYSMVKIRPSFAVGAKSLFAALAMSVFLWFFSGLNLFLLIMLGAFVYFAVLFLIGGIKKEEFLMLIKRKNENSFT